MNSGYTSPRGVRKVEEGEETVSVAVSRAADPVCVKLDSLQRQGTYPQPSGEGR